MWEITERSAYEQIVRGCKRVSDPVGAGRLSTVSILVHVDTWVFLVEERAKELGLLCRRYHCLLESRHRRPFVVRHGASGCCCCVVGHVDVDVRAVVARLVRRVLLGVLVGRYPGFVVFQVPLQVRLLAERTVTATALERPLLTVNVPDVPLQVR